MVSRLKDFNILRVHWKIWLLGEEVHRKPRERGGDCLKGGLGQFADLRGTWQERGGGVFEGGWHPNAYYELNNLIISSKKIWSFMNYLLDAFAMKNLYF